MKEWEAGWEKQKREGGRKGKEGDDSRRKEWKEKREVGKQMYGDDSWRKEGKGKREEGREGSKEEESGKEAGRGG